VPIATPSPLRTASPTRWTLVHADRP